MNKLANEVLKNLESVGDLTDNIIYITSLAKFIARVLTVKKQDRVKLLPDLKQALDKIDDLSELGISFTSLMIAIKKAILSELQRYGVK